MITQKTIPTFQCKLKDLKYLTFQMQKDMHMVTLIDAKGYGNTRVEALNDLHNNLI